MTRSYGENYLAAREAGTADPIIIADFEHGKIITVEVSDYTVATGDTVTVGLTGGNTIFTEGGGGGTGFTAATSNAATALSLGTAMGNTFDNGENTAPDAYIWVFRTTVYVLVPFGDTLTAETSDTTAFTITTVTEGRQLLCTGPTAIGDYQPEIVEVGPQSQKIDPLLFHYQEPETVTMVLRGDRYSYIRWLFGIGKVRGVIVRVKRGYRGMDVADYEDAGVFSIQDASPEDGGNLVALKLGDHVTDAVWARKVAPEVLNRHPLEAARKVLEATGVASADIDTDDFDPTEYSDIGHYVVSRHSFGTGWNGIFDGETTPPAQSARLIGSRSNRGAAWPRRINANRRTFGRWNEEQECLNLLNELATIVGGAFLPGPDGTFKFRQFDINGTVARTITQDDWIGPPEQVDVFAETFTEVIAELPHDLDGNSVALHQRNLFAGHRHAQPGLPPWRRPFEITSEWMMGCAFFRGKRNGLNGDELVPIDGDGTEILLAFPMANGLSGTRAAVEPTPPGTPPTFTQSTNTDTTASRPVYLLFFEEDQFENGRREIIKCDAFDVSTSANLATETWNEGYYTIDARAQLGTTALSWSPTIGGGIRVYDITAYVDRASELLSRIGGFGLPAFTGQIPRNFDELEPMDLIGVEDLAFAVPGTEVVEEGVTGVALVTEVENAHLDDRAAVTITAYMLYLFDVDESPNLATPVTPIAVNPDPEDRFINRWSLLLVDGSWVDYFGVTELDGATEAWWSGWVKVKNTTGDKVIISRFDSGNEQFEIRLVGDDVRAGVQGATLGAELTTTNVIQNNTWHHIGVLYDGGATTLTIYVDGLSQASTTAGTIPSSLSTGGGSDLRIGARSGVADGGDPFEGALDEWAMWDEAGSANTVSEAYNSGTPRDLDRMGTIGPPDVLWRFEQSLEPDTFFSRAAHRAQFRNASGNNLLPFFSSDVPP